MTEHDSARSASARSATEPGTPWHRGMLVGFDLETTGVNPLTARVVTAALIYQQPDGSAASASQRWLIDPGIPIPASAEQVHGISTAHARAHGSPAADGVAAIAQALEAAWSAGLPIVVFNAAYDLTLIAAALRRHGLPELTSRAGWRDALVIDPLVIDRGVDRYRRGKRTLEAMAAHYGVSTPHSHAADGDALAACAVARSIAAAFPEAAEARPTALMSQQREWSSAWAANFQSYLRSRGKADAVIDGAWPLRGV